MDKNKYQRQRRAERMSDAKKLLGGKCNLCGSKDRLQFDHIDPKTKVCCVSKAIGWSEKRFWEEVNKCQLLCHKCHVEKSKVDGTRNIPNHGQRSMYAYHGCRCELCREAQKLYQREYIKR